MSCIHAHRHALQAVSCSFILFMCNNGFGQGSCLSSFTMMSWRLRCMMKSGSTTLISSQQPFWVALLCLHRCYEPSLYLPLPMQGHESKRISSIAYEPPLYLPLPMQGHESKRISSIVLALSFIMTEFEHVKSSLFVISFMCCAGRARGPDGSSEGRRWQAPEEGEASARETEPGPATAARQEGAP